MHDFDPFERRLGAALRSDADENVGPFEAEAVARAAIDGIGGRHPSAPGLLSSRRAVRPGPRHHAPRGGRAADRRWGLGGGLRRPADAVGRAARAGPVVRSGHHRIAGRDGIAAATHRDADHNADAEASESPSPTPASLNLAWTKVPLDEKSPRLAWLGDRFVLVDTKSGAVRTSTDGANWQVLQPGDADPGYVDLLRGSFASWQDSAVGWWNPQDREGPDIAGAPPITARDVLQIVHPPAAPTSTTPFKGRIESIGIGPKGIVAEVHSDLDWDAWITKKLGLRTNNDWTWRVKSVTYQNGVLQIKLNNRPGLKVVWADQGFEPGDYQDRGFGWFSPDGEHWTEMAPNDPARTVVKLPTADLGASWACRTASSPPGHTPMARAPDPNGSCTGMWYSSDGLTWRLLGTAPEIRPSGRELCIRDGCSELAGELVPWRGGALAIDVDGRVEFWTSGGSAKLPMAAQAHGTVATGPLGLVSIGDGKVLVSRDGIDYKVSPIPGSDGRRGKRRREPTVVAVGDQTVLVLKGAG